MFPQTCLTYLEWDKVDPGSCILIPIMIRNTVIYILNVSLNILNYPEWDEVDLGSCILNLLWTETVKYMYVLNISTKHV